MRVILKKPFYVFVLLILTNLCSGCWDYKEVEKRGYVLGIAIDKANPIPKGYEEEEDHQSEIKLETMELQKGNPKFAYTIQIPILPKAQINPFGAGGSGGGAEARTWDLTIMGNSMFEVVREFATRLDYAPFFEHLQAVVISEEVARDGIVPPLDMIIRDPEMRRRTKVFIAPGEAKKILDVVPRIDDYPSVYLAQLPENANKTSRMAHVTDLGEVSESIHGKVDFVLPMVVPSKDEIKNAGVAVFIGDKMVGRLGEVHTIYAKWIRDAVIGGVIVIKAPDRPDVYITLEIKKVKTKVRPIVNGEEITMDIKSEAEVNIASESETHFDNLLDDDLLQKIESIAENEVKGKIEETIEYVQKNIGADVFHFSVILKSFEPKVWDKVKEDWHEIFPGVKAIVDVKVDVNYIGTVN